MQADMIASAVHAPHLLLEPTRLLILFIGVLIGLAIGVLPGLNGVVGMARRGAELRPAAAGLGRGDDAGWS